MFDIFNFDLYELNSDDEIALEFLNVLGKTTESDKFQSNSDDVGVLFQLGTILFLKAKIKSPSFLDPLMVCNYPFC